MFLAKTTSSCCTSTSRALPRLQFIWWATRFAPKAPPTRCSSSLRASYKRYGKWWFLLLFLFGSFGFLPLFSFGTFCFLFFFTPTSFDANTRYISTSACQVARKLHGTNVQSPSNHQELASIRHGNRKDIVWLTKEWQGVKIGEVIPFVDDFHPLL